MTKIFFNPPLFPEHTVPFGFLAKDMAVQACWYYYVCAQNTLESLVYNQIQYEGQKDTEMNLKQLHTSIARMYNIEPEEMVFAWKDVDMQAVALGLPQLPDEERYRFNRPIVVN